MQLLTRNRLSLAATLEGNHWTFGLFRREIGRIDVNRGHRRTATGGGVVCLWPVSSRSSLVQSLVLLDIVSTKAEAFVSSPEAIHEFIVSFCVKEDCWG